MYTAHEGVIAEALMHQLGRSAPQMIALVLNMGLTYPAIVQMWKGRCWKRVQLVVMRWADEC